MSPTSASRSWEDALQRLEGAYSHQTVLAYGADFRNFADWCRTKRRSFLPATPETVGTYLDAISVDLKPATLRRRTAAIRKIHRLTRHVDPTDDEIVVLALRRRGAASQVASVRRWGWRARFANVWWRRAARI